MNTAPMNVSMIARGSSWAISISAASQRAALFVVTTGEQQGMSAPTPLAIQMSSHHLAKTPFCGVVNGQPQPQRRRRQLLRRVMKQTLLETHTLPPTQVAASIWSEHGRQSTLDLNNGD